MGQIQPWPLAYCLQLFFWYKAKLSGLTVTTVPQSWKYLLSGSLQKFASFGRISQPNFPGKSTGVVAISCYRGSSWPRSQTRAFGLTCTGWQVLGYCTTWEALPSSGLMPHTKTQHSFGKSLGFGDRSTFEVQRHCLRVMWFLLINYLTSPGLSFACVKWSK